MSTNLGAIQFDAHKREIAAAAVVALGLTGAGGAMAGDKPAVSGINGKVEVSGGDVGRDGYWAGAASLAAPIGKSFGVQADVLGGDVSSSVKGFGLHAFWRDPDVALAGVTASRTGFGSTFGNRFGVEGEYYLDKITISATGGIQNGELQHTGYGTLNASYYLNDNLSLEAGGGGVSATRYGRLGFEYQPNFGINGLSFFGDIGHGTRDYTHAFAGLKFYFGAGDKSLKRRHREDDPVNMLLNGVQQVVAQAAGAAAASNSGGSACVGGGCGGGP